MRRRSVALLVETSNAYARGILAGIVAYVRQHPSWSIWLPELGRGDAPPRELARWRGDGIIARIETREIARAVARSGRPVVDVSAGRHLPGVPWVETDDRAIAEAAAAHLVDRGFRRLAFCGDARFNWSRWREEHFRRRAGPDVRVFEAGRGSLASWVRALPKPAGVFACYDIMAQRLLDACREAKVAVPEQVAVVGVDNDALICDLASPPLSSVIPNTRRTGFLAASLLDRMMAGRRVPARAHLIAPLGVETRQSTDVLAIDDRPVAAALRFIREHAFEGITVRDVLRAVPLSRRALEGRFRAAVGRSPHDEIARLRIDRAKRLLAETDQPLDRVAALAGFESQSYFSVAFRRETGANARQFRRAARG
jgi:LacI family transcriptional regulator